MKSMDLFISSNREEIISSFSTLVKIESVPVYSSKNSPPYGEGAAKALDCCSKMLSDWGFPVNNYDYHCIKTSLPYESQEKEIVFAAHCDVVQADEDCIFPPFLGEVRDNYLIGRGSVDDKGPLIAVAYAFKYFKENNIKLNNKFSFIIGANEEGGMSDIDYYLQREPQPTLGISVDDDFPVVKGEKTKYRLSIQGEKSGDYVKIECKKDLRQHFPFLVYAIDESQTISYKKSEKENNPIVSLIEDFKSSKKRLFSGNEENFIINGMGDEILRKLPNCQEGIITPVSINTDGNIVNFEFSLTLSPLVTKQNILDYIFYVEREYKVKIKIIKEDKGYLLEDTDPVVELLTSVYNKAAGENCKAYIMKGSTYARKFQKGLGFGGGSQKEIKPFVKGHGGCHGPDEAHNIDVLIKAIEVYIKAIMKLDEYYS